MNTTSYWAEGIFVGLLLGLFVFSPSDSYKDSLRMEGYNQARAEIAATQPALTTRDSGKFSGLEAEK